MKTLKKVASGFVAEEDGATSSSMFNIAGDVIKESSGICLKDAHYFTNMAWDNVVMECLNTYEPLVYGDMGGVKVARGRDHIEFLEYFGDPVGETSYVRIVKEDNIYSGYSSIDGVMWNYKGSYGFPDAGSIGLITMGNTSMNVTKIRLYKSTKVSFGNLDVGWRVDVSLNSVNMASVTSSSKVVQVPLPSFPNNYVVKVYDETNTLVSDCTLQNVWGGDEYICTLDLSIVDENNNSVSLDIVKQLGKLDGGSLDKKLFVKNNTSTSQTVTLSITVYSPFYDWVNLAVDYLGIPNKYTKSAVVAVPAGGRVPFWLGISRPLEFNKEFDFARKPCIFYLELR